MKGRVNKFFDEWLERKPNINGGTMKDQTFTMNEIRKAIDKVHQYPNYGGDDVDEFCDSLEKELTRPPVEFAAGEVAMMENCNGEPTPIIIGDPKWRQPGDGKTARKQTTTESGAQELIDALECVADMGNGNPESVCAQAAVIKWRRDRGE